MQPLSGNQSPDIRTALIGMSLVLRMPGEAQLCRSSSNVPRRVHFLNSQTSKSKMRFAPQRRAIFQQLNFQKRSEPEVFCASWCFSAQPHAIFHLSSLILPDASTPAALASLLFGPPGCKTLQKQSVSRLFYFSRALIFFLSLLFLSSSDTFSSQTPLLLHLSRSRMFDF